MLFLLLYQLISSTMQNINSNQFPKSFSSKAENFQSYNKLISDSHFVNLKDTSYFKPYKIDLDQISANYIYFRSLQGTQYVLLKNIQSLSKKSISFDSIFVNIESTNLTVFNLTLIESPIFCSKGPISIQANFFSSDFLSIPSNYVSTINVSQQFSVLNHENEDIISEDHAKIIMHEDAKYYQSPSYESEAKILIKEDLTDSSNDLQNDSDNITAFYDLNSTLKKIHIYNNYVIAEFDNMDDNMNLTTNSSREIEINTTSTSLEISIYRSQSSLNHAILDLYLVEKCQVTFDQSFDFVTNSIILSDIRIHHSKNLIAISHTSVPYVTFIPADDVTFVPERQNIENYCLCLKSRFESCVENNECLLYHIDKSKYFFGSNSSFISSIARSKAQIINIYVTYTGISTTDFHIVELKPSPNGKIYNFISISSAIQTILSVHDTALDETSNVSLSFTDISRVTLDAKDGVIYNLTLKNSPITIDKSFSVPFMTTDLVSLSLQQSGTIRIKSILTIWRQSALEVIGLALIMLENSELKIMEISEFPQILISQKSIGFSDGDIEFSIQIENEGPATISIEDSAEAIDSIIRIGSENANIQLNLLFVFNLVNPMIIYFTNIRPLPENVRYSFKPMLDEMSTLSLIMPMNEEGGANHYNFENITGNLNLILLTPETVFTFITSSERGDFHINNIPTLSLNLLDIISNVVLYEDSVLINSVYDISLKLEKSCVYQQLTLLTNASKPVTLSLGNEEMTEVFPLVIESITSNTSVFFDDSFRQLLKYPPDSVRKMLDSIIIKHHSFNVTLMTSLEEVPLVVVDEDTVGVLYVATQKNFFIPNNTYPSYRSGPELIVNITKGPNSLEDESVKSEDLVIINQSDFLAEKVTFVGNPFILKARAKSLVNYTIIDSEISIDLEESKNKTWFEAYSLNLKKSAIKSISNINVDYLNSDIYSLTKNSIKNLVASKRSSITDDSLMAININADQIMLTSSNPTDTTTSIKGNYWNIYYGGSHSVDVTITEKKLIQRVELILIGDTEKTIKFDKSWFNVTNANNFVIVVNKSVPNVTVEADLMNMPNITVVDTDYTPANFTVVLYKVIYTNKLSFIIFITLVLIISIISIILLIVGFCRYQNKLNNFDVNYRND